MAQKRSSQPSASRDENRSSAPPQETPSASAGSQKETAPKSGANHDGKEAALQVSSLAAKLVELADVGVSLGINFISMLNSLARSQITGAVLNGNGHQVAPEREPHASPPAAGVAAESTASRSYCIVNRTLIHAGGPVRVSFSINNDLPDVPKKLFVAVEGFVGATRGFAFDGGGFTVTPGEASIEPMDFERFVLRGAIPEEAPEDSYNGWIVVEGDEQMRIPVMLVVTKG